MNIKSLLSYKRANGEKKVNKINSIISYCNYNKICPQYLKYFEDLKSIVNLTLS